MTLVRHWHSHGIEQYLSWGAQSIADFWRKSFAPIHISHHASVTIASIIFLLPLHLPPCQADVTVQLEAGDDVEEATLNVINSVLAFIDSNPPKWRRLSNQPIF